MSSPGAGLGLYAIQYRTLRFAVQVPDRATISRMLRAPKPYTPPDGDLLETYSRHYNITATCPCGHSRELFARPIQAMLGKGVLIGRVRSCLRCHKCQKRMPTITVTRMPR